MEVGHLESLGQDGGGTWRPVVPGLPVVQPDRLLGEPALGTLGVEPAQEVLPRNHMAMNQAAKERVPCCFLNCAYGSYPPSRVQDLVLPRHVAHAWEAFPTASCEILLL